MTDGIEHETVVARIVEESGWTLRYGFMILMSAGIAELGLLLSSPAVVIGAMLISPLMSPILGLGFSLALIDAREMRRSLVAMVIGAILAVLFTALIVMVSPLKAATAEILSRTRPNLFDLLVALFAALAGSFAIIRGKGETIVGVAIATALMPPLAVVGYGLATWNLPVLTGSLALFSTNFVTIALSATVMARLYGFGGRLSSRQTWLQTGFLIVVFVIMAIPLGVALSRIAAEAVTTNQVRSYLTNHFGAKARINQLDVEFGTNPLTIRAVVIAPRSRAQSTSALQSGLAGKLARSVVLQIDQVLLDGAGNTLEAQKASLRQAERVSDAEANARAVTQAVAVAAGVPASAVLMDSGKQLAQARAPLLPGATFETYQTMEARAQAVAGPWQVQIVPPLQPLPAIHFAYGSDALNDTIKAQIAATAWAAHRWNLGFVAVPGLPDSPPSKRPRLNQRRALAIATLLKLGGVAVRPAPGGGQSVQLQIAS